MKNILSFCKENIWKILTILFAVLFLVKGCTFTKVNSVNKKITSLELKIDSLQKQIDNTSTSKEVRDEMEKVMLDYLIYEDDLDKGKASISSIKNKIESND